MHWHILLHKKAPWTAAILPCITAAEGGGVGAGPGQGEAGGEGQTAA